MNIETDHRVENKIQVLGKERIYLLFLRDVLLRISKNTSEFLNNSHEVNKSSEKDCGKIKNNIFTPNLASSTTDDIVANRFLRDLRRSISFFFEKELNFLISFYGKRELRALSGYSNETRRVVANCFLTNKEKKALIADLNDRAQYHIDKKHHAYEMLSILIKLFEVRDDEREDLKIFLDLQDRLTKEMIRICQSLDLSNLVENKKEEIIDGKSMGN